MRNGMLDMQSPININTSQCRDASQRNPLRLYGKKAARKPVTCVVEETETGVQMTWDSEVETTVRFSEHTYKLEQFHLHFPAEHKINGFACEAELHLVHTCATPDDEEMANTPQRHLVIAVFFALGRKKSKFLDAVIDRDNNTVAVKLKMLSLKPSFWEYDGSLTTDPYSENVKWIVMHKINTMTESQMNSLVNILPHDNTRDIQDICDREITSYYHSSQTFYDILWGPIGRCLAFGKKQPSGTEAAEGQSNSESQREVQTISRPSL